MKINELRILIQEIIAEETSLDEIHILLPGLDNEKATQSYRDTEDAYKAGYLAGWNNSQNKYSRLNEDKINDEDEGNEIKIAFKSSPKMIPWKIIEKTFKNTGMTGEEFFAGVEDEFRNKFEGKPVSREAYYNFFTGLPTAYGQDDMYAMVNWINFTNPNLAIKLYDMI